MCLLGRVARRTHEAKPEDRVDLAEPTFHRAAGSLNLRTPSLLSGTYQTRRCQLCSGHIYLLIDAVGTTKRASKEDEITGGLNLLGDPVVPCCTFEATLAPSAL